MRALIYGAAPCLFDGMRAALRLGGFDRLYAVNAAEIHLPIADVWVTLHPENMPRWQRVMAMKGLPIPEVVSKHGLPDGSARIDRTATIYWPGMSERSVNSALFACKIALDDGADRIVLCGSPLDASGHLDQGQPQHQDYARYRAAFDWARDNVFAGRVRAIGCDFLRAPTRRWLNG